MLLKDKNAVVTGCSRGIGKEVVRVFAENGANIWACIRKENQNFTKYVNILEQQHSVKINLVYFDLENEEETSRCPTMMLNIDQDEFKFSERSTNRFEHH